MAKDPCDPGTRDAFAKPSRGRPPSPTTKTPAQRQRELRSRRRKAGWIRAELSPDHVALIASALDAHTPPPSLECAFAHLRRVFCD